MKAPAFWWRRHAGPTAIMLWPASRVWGGMVSRRMRRPPVLRPPIPVVCVGNYTTGGEGKTPTAITLGGIARAAGLTPGFLTRGYGGQESGPIVVDARIDSADRVGDEALLLAKAGVTVLSRYRPAGAALLAEVGADIVIMDDGFQNPSLAKDLTFIVADAAAGLGNRMILPAGPLRAPLRQQLQMTDALIIIGDGESRERLTRLASRAGRRILRASLVPVDPLGWDDRKVLAFAGIGRPAKFFATLEAAGAHFAGRVSYPDHHMLTEEEAGRLLAHARGGSVRLVTTEKDMARLAGAGGVLAELRETAEAFPVRLEFEDTEAVRLMMLDAVDRVRTRRSVAGG